MHVVVIMEYDEMKKKKKGRTLKFLRECREVSDKKKKKTKVVAINGKGY